MLNIFENKNAQRLIGQTLIVLLSIFLLLLIFTYLPVTYLDWIESFRPAARNWRQPYQGLTFNPPWLFIILYPLSILPPRLGAAILILLSFVILIIYVKSPLKTLIIACSAPMIVLITLGQIDALMLLGLMLPYSMSLPILMIKPQGVFLSAIKRLNAFSLTFLFIIITVSVFIWGSWWNSLTNLNEPLSAEYNLSIFPYSIVLAPFLFYKGIRKKSDALLCMASLSISPYFMITSLLPTVASIIRETNDKKLWFITIMGSWIYYFLVK